MDRINAYRASYASRYKLDKNVVSKFMRDNVIYRDVRSQIYLWSMHRKLDG